ncbi:hypothetical protein [Candidatus Nitrosotenuis cloacae]|uniref:hypothetical protein n=1 Tax=Candidatus Nitrosotenuis cloacae TaxID=1603555 RepID=UPI00228047CE|nr:hypothetical protein [Candidatus Nitrosotenuis cloacae]
MEQLLDQKGKFEEEIAELKQAIYTLEAINEMLEARVENTESHQGQGWLEVKNQDTILSILTAYADPIKKGILDEMERTPMTIQDIIRHLNFPQASVYRKITQLIDCKLVQKHGYYMQNDRRVYKYSSTIKNMRIHFEEEQTMMFVRLRKEDSEFHKLLGLDDSKV